MPKYQSDSNFAVSEDPLLPKSHGQLNIRSSFVRANAQKTLRCFLPRQVNICTSLNTKLLCSTLSADLATLLRGWQPRKQAAAVYRVRRICSETSPRRVHTQLLSIFFFFLTLWKKLEEKKIQKKKKSQNNWSTSNGPHPQVKTFWGWFLTEGSWETSKTFLGRQGGISKQGLSEPRQLSSRTISGDELSRRGWEKAWTSAGSHESKG